MRLLLDVADAATALKILGKVDTRVPPRALTLLVAAHDPLPEGFHTVAIIPGGADEICTLSAGKIRRHRVPDLWPT